MLRWEVAVSHAEGGASHHWSEEVILCALELDVGGVGEGMREGRERGTYEVRYL